MQAEGCRIRWLLCDVVVFGDAGREVAFAAHAEVAADERLEIAVENLVYIAYFYAGAEVFRHAIGLQDVAADLRTELDVELGVFELAADRFLLVELVLVEARAEKLHRPFLVFVLGTLVLAASYEAGGN